MICVLCLCIVCYVYLHTDWWGGGNVWTVLCVCEQDESKVLDGIQGVGRLWTGEELRKFWK